MNRTGMHSLDPASARKKIGAAKSNKTFMMAVLDRDQLGHRAALAQWTKLHEAAFPDPSSSAMRSEMRRADETAAGKANGLSSQDRRHRDRTNRRLGRPAIRLAQAIEDEGLPWEVETPLEGQGDAVSPIVNMEADRVQVLLDDAPARFEIKDNPNANPEYGLWRANHALGALAVRRHEAIIEREAADQGVDANLIKAIMYIEYAQGYHDALHTALGVDKSLRPMNIRSDPWAGLDDPPADLTDPATNIRTSVTLIRRITERIGDPTPSKVASIWNSTGRENVSDFGARVERAMGEVLWQVPLPDPQSPLDVNAP